MKISLKLNKNQIQALCDITSSINLVSGGMYDSITVGAIKETIWNFYVKLGRRLPDLKQKNNKLALSAVECWALWIGLRYTRTNLSTYEMQQVNYILGIIHQKSI